MSEIEEEIRRRLIAERQAQQAAQMQDQSEQDVLSRPAFGEAFSSNGGSSERTAWPPAPNLPPQNFPTARSAPPQMPIPPPQRVGTLQRWKSQGGILGTIATILLFLAKVGAPILALLSKFKFLAIGLKLLLTIGSMVVSVWAYGHIYGIPFGIGIVALIFIHECGHAIAGLMRGHKIGVMVFIPFMGAFVTVGRAGENIAESAFVGIMGPVFGTLASLGSLAIYAATQSPLFLAIAEFGFFINLFNLMPIPPLDGGWITPLFSPKLLAIGAVFTVFVGFMNPLIWVLGLLSLPRIISGWKADPKTQPYFRASGRDKWIYGLSYVGLIIFLGLGYLGLHEYMLTHVSGAPLM